MSTQSRGHEGSGEIHPRLASGRGLAIVKTCVEACGGTVAAASATAHGLEVSLKLEVVQQGGDSS